MALLLVLAAGCGGKQQHRFSPTEGRLSKLGLSYGQFTGVNEGRPPRDVNELRRYVAKSTSDKQLAAMNVANADELFTSERDGKPFMMVPLKRLPPPSDEGQPVVVFYEQAGEDGNRFVAFMGGGVEEVDAERFKTLVPSAD